MLAAPKVGDAATSRAIADVALAVREEQQDPKIKRSGGVGDVFFRAQDGTIKNLPAATNGDTLRLAGGLPTWSLADPPPPFPVDVPVNRYSSVILPPAQFNGGQATNRSLGDNSLKAVYMGKAPRNFVSENVTVRLRTTADYVAGTTGTTWAEVAIATGAVVAGGSPTLTVIAFADASTALAVPTGTKSIVIGGVSIGNGVDWWLMVGNAIGTGGGASSANLRSFTVGEDLEIGVQGVMAGTRPSSVIGVGVTLVPDANNVNALWMALIV
jgi:hypothetical protein